MQELALPIIRGLRRLGWTHCSDEHALQSWNWSANACLLRSLAASELLSASGRSQLTRVCDAGLELRYAWPRAWSSSLGNWIGSRLYLSYAGNFSVRTKFATVVSSALGRHGQRLPDWPHLLDLALQSIVRNSQTLLVAPGTTTASSASEFADLAHVACVTLERSEHCDIESWIFDGLQEFNASAATHLRTHIGVSPPADEDGSLQGPLQDRLAIGLSDSVLALSVRQAGNISRLLKSRLDDERFPIGSVLLALPERNTAKRPSSAASEWLGGGVVGWYVPPHLIRPPIQLSRCRQTVHLPAQQLCSPCPGTWSNYEDSESKCLSSKAVDKPSVEWPWLVHCTRGTAGPLPEESDSQYRRRLWLEGKCAEAHPLLTIHRIVQSQQLLGTSRITRTKERSLSFSSVPLMQLLDRRQFRSHLGRWDWEPYGLLVRIEALRALGARPVIYADASSFSTLPKGDRAFFQPTGEAQDWSAEREWRLLGDLELDRLDDAIVLFVKTKTEAQQLSRYSRWPVLWTT